MSNFFIDRPIFAAVLAILITLAGAIAFALLPVCLLYTSDAADE